MNDAIYLAEIDLYLVGTSTSGITVGTGPAELILETDQPFEAGMRVSVHEATGAARLDAVVVAYIQTDRRLVLDVESVSGGGTYSAWRAEGARTLLVATGRWRTGPDDPDRPGIEAMPLIVEPPSFQAFAFRDGRIGGRSAGGGGEMILNNADRFFDRFAGAGWDGRRFRLFRGPVGGRWRDFVLLFSGTASQVEWRDARFHLFLRDRQAQFEVPIQRETYEGTNSGSTGNEGTPQDIRGRPKILCYGLCHNVTLAPLNTAALRYGAHTGSIFSVDELYDRGAPLSKVTGTPAAGQYRENVTEGHVTLGGSPAGTITAKVSGERLENLFLWSEQFMNPAWTKDEGVTVENDVIIGPNGGYTAERIDIPASAGAGFRQSVSVTAGQPYTFSIYLRSVVGNVTLGMGIEAATEEPIHLDEAWRRYTLTETVAGASVSPGIFSLGDAAAIYAWGAQVELGGVAKNGIITGGTLHPSSYTAQPADMLRTIAVTRSELVDFLDLDHASFQALNEATSGIGLGLFIDQEMTISETFDLICGSIGGFWYFTRDGRLAVRRLEAPTGNPVAVFDRTQVQDVRLLSRNDEGQGLPNHRVVLGWRRNWTVQEGDQLAGSVSADRRAFLKEEYRIVQRDAPAVKRKHPLSVELRRMTLLESETDAEDEAERQLALMSVRRDLVELDVTVDEYFLAGAPWLGDEIAYRDGHFLDYADGRNLILIGVTESHAQGRAILQAWG